MRLRSAHPNTHPGPVLLFLTPCSAPRVYSGLCSPPPSSRDNATEPAMHRGMTAGSVPHLVDVLHTLHAELSQSGYIELPAAIRAQLDLQLLLGFLPQQVPARGNTSAPISHPVRARCFQRCSTMQMCTQGLRRTLCCRRAPAAAAVTPPAPSVRAGQENVSHSLGSRSTVSKYNG